MPVTTQFLDQELCFPCLSRNTAIREHPCGLVARYLLTQADEEEKPEHVSWTCLQAKTQQHHESVIAPLLRVLC